VLRRAILIAWWILATVAAASAAPEPVGEIHLMEGRVGVFRPGLPTWYAGFAQMPLYVGDQIATDGSSRAIIELRLGGTLGLDHATAIHIVGTRPEVEGPGALRDVKVMRGAVWSKFSKQHEPFHFRTGQGIVTITGTELVIEEATDSGGSVEVLEGQVTYAPASTPQAPADGAPAAAPTPVVAAAGTQVKMSQVPTVNTYPARDLRREAEKRHPGLRDGVIQQVLGAVGRYIPYSGLINRYVADPKQAAIDLARQQTGNNDVLNQAANAVQVLFNAHPDEGFPTGLSPDRATVNPNELAFSWQDAGHHDRYLVVVSLDEQFRSYDWTATTSGSMLRFPADAMPLAPGQTYYWRVVGLSRSNKPQGKASQSFFTVPADYRPPASTADLSSAVGPPDRPIALDPHVAPSPVVPLPPPSGKHANGPRVPHPKPLPASSRPVNTKPKPVAAKPKPAATAKPVAVSKPDGARHPGRYGVGRAPGWQLDPLQIPSGATEATFTGWAWDAKGVASVTIDGHAATLVPVSSFDVAAKRKRPHCVNFSLSIPLQSGRTTVTVSATNLEGLAFSKEVPLGGGGAAVVPASPPASLGHASAPLPGRGHRFALLIGVSDYRSKDINPLRFPSRDVRMLREILTDPARGGYAAEDVRVLESGGEEPTRANIGKAMNWLAGRASHPDDLVFIYFSGHGYNDPRSGSYLIAADTNLQAINTTAINVSEFNKSLALIGAGKKVIVFDSCHSGGVDRTARGASALTQKDVAALLGDSARGEIRMMSCGPNESSYESQDLNDGVFSYYLARGLKGDADLDRDGVVTPDELKNYLQLKVGEWAARHGHQQTPRMSGEWTGRFILSGGAASGGK
jgi:hypothetical protein